MFLLISLCRSYEITCESPLKHAPPVDDAELVWIGVVTRHGIRTPMDSWTPKNVSGDWYCDGDDAPSPRMHISTANGFTRRYERVLEKKFVPFQPNCESGELTIQGMNQHMKLGEFYRQWLVNETGFLTPYLDKSQVSIRASKIERCQRSAIGFMTGFYPPAVPGERIEMVTGSDYREYLWPAPGGCHDMQVMWDDWVATPAFQERMNKSKALYADIYKNISLKPDDTNWMFIGDWMSSYICSDQQIPLVYPTDDVITQALKDIAYYSYGYFNTSRAVAASAIWRKIFSDIDSYLGKSTSIGKFRLYSAHDTTIIALLVSLGYYDDALPPFRSHFTVELWRKDSKYYLRNVFNGEPVPIDFMNNQNLVSYTELKTTMSNRGDLNYCLAEFPVE